jgi:Metalloenzyme superfamily
MKQLFTGLTLLISLAANSQDTANSLNVFIITTDGFRWQEIFTGADSNLINDTRYVQDTGLLKQMYWDSTAELRRQKLMPFFWTTIAKNGQLFGNRLYQSKVNVSNVYKISYPGYNEMFTGYADPVFIPNIPIRNRNINILEYLNSQADYKGKVAAFSSWNLFTSILNRKRNNLPVNSGYEDLPDDGSVNNELINATQDSIQDKKNTRYDQLTFLNACEYIKVKQPKVVLLGFGETDQFAHSGRYDMYLQQASAVDKMISELWYYVQTNPFYKNRTIFIITTDHGRGEKTSAWYKHGILTKGSSETWMAFMGPGISAEGEIKINRQTYQNQLASTIAGFLNKKFDSSKNHAEKIQINNPENQKITRLEMSFVNLR